MDIPLHSFPTTRISSHGADKNFPLTTDVYKLDRPYSPPWMKVVSRAKEQFLATGCALITNFLREEILNELRRETLRFEKKTCSSKIPFSPYPPYIPSIDQTLPQDHPEKHIGQRSNRFVPYDELPQRSLLRELYEWDKMTIFVNACLGCKQITPLESSQSACVLSLQAEGESMDWHFDGHQYTVTLLIQAPLMGGEFEYVPFIRSPGAPNFSGIKAVLDGNVQKVIRMPFSSGDLVIFEGHNSLHRTTATRGPIWRQVALLSYVDNTSLSY